MKVCRSHYCAQMQTQFKLVRHFLLLVVCVCAQDHTHTQLLGCNHVWPVWNKGIVFHRVKPEEQTWQQMQETSRHMWKCVLSCYKIFDDLTLMLNQWKADASIITYELLRSVDTCVSILCHYMFYGPLIWQMHTKTRWKCFLNHL